MIPSVIDNVTSTTLTTEASARHRVEVNNLVSLRIGGEWVTVLVVDLPVMGYHPEDQQTCNCVAVQLLEANLITAALQRARRTRTDPGQERSEGSLEVGDTGQAAGSEYRLRASRLEDAAGHSSRQSAASRRGSVPSQ